MLEIQVASLLQNLKNDKQKTFFLNLNIVIKRIKNSSIIQLKLDFFNKNVLVLIYKFAIS